MLEMMFVESGKVRKAALTGWAWNLWTLSSCDGLTQRRPSERAGKRGNAKCILNVLTVVQIGSMGGVCRRRRNLVKVGRQCEFRLHNPGKPVQNARLGYHGVPGLLRLVEKSLIASKEKDQWVFHPQAGKQVLTRFLGHVRKTSGHGAQVLDHSDGDASQVLLLQVKQMQSEGGAPYTCNPQLNSLTQRQSTGVEDLEQARPLSFCRPKTVFQCCRGGILVRQDNAEIGKLFHKRKFEVLFPGCGISKNRPSELEAVCARHH